MWFLGMAFGGIKHIYIAGNPSPPSIFSNFLSSQTEALPSLK